jgi:arylsulfatase A-like enzyme/tetratricopeptide (TPR) repeat protein
MPIKPAISRFRRARIWLIAAGITGLVVLLFVFPRGRGREPAELVRRSWAQRGVAKPNIVLVTLDTTRADHLGVYGYSDARTPAVDTLARQGVLFTQAASPAPLTLPAHSSILTGLYPTYHGVRLNGNAALGQEQTTLAEVLSRNGYQTGAFIGAFVLDGRWGLNQGFGVYDDQFDLRKFAHLDLAAVQRPGDQVMDAALRWLEAKKDGPFFAWVHLYDAHSPYEAPEPLFSEFRGRGLAGLYDGEIAFADRQVARCMSWLQNAGLDQKSIVVIAGDHGESLGSHGEGTHGFFVYDYAVHVPLIVAAPLEELRGVRIESQVSLVDVFPTVLALAGIDSASKVHGRSLLPLMLQSKPDEKDETVYAYAESMSPSLQYGWSPLHSLRSPRFKFIQAPRPELYDLVADPDETTNVFDTHRKLGRDMAQALDRLMTDTSRGAPTPEAANLDRETMARLASLGYVGSPTPAKKAGSSPLADPKDKLTVFAAVQRAGELMVKDEHASAAQALESALTEEPTMPQARLMLGTCYAELGRRKDARAQFDAVLKDDPQSVQALLGMANILLADGQTQDVITLCKRTLSLDDRNTQAYALLGDVYIAQREPSKALPYLEKAVEIQPKMSQNRLNLAACLIEVKQLARAQTTLEEIVAEHPKFPGAQFNLGVLYEELGRPEQARAAYATEVVNYPHSFKARFNLGKILSRLEDWPGSIEQMREVIRIAPKQPEGYLFLARGLLHEAAPLDEVQGLAEKGLSLAKTPDLKALGWFLMADVFNRRHEPENVNRALRNARMQVAANARGSQPASSSP